MSNKIIEAKIAFKKRYIPIIICLVIISIVLYFFVTYVSVVEEEEFEGYYYYYGYNLFEDRVFSTFRRREQLDIINEGFYFFQFDTSYPVSFNLGWINIYNIFDWGSTSLILKIVFLCLIVTIYLIIVAIYSRLVYKKYSLILENTRLIGRRAKLFTTNELILPMNKIDNVHVKNGLMDWLYGGKTVAIRSASGLVKFPWVQNAQEFVDTTLAEIQKYNETVQMKQTESAPAAESDSLDKIQKLKSLLDQGLISQEEFEAKRKELLEKI